MNTTSGKRAAVFEIDLSTVIGAGTTCNALANVACGKNQKIFLQHHLEFALQGQLSTISNVIGSV